MIALFAHLTPTGFGAWGDGMARLFLEPTELLLVMGLVLLAVQAGLQWLSAGERRQLPGAAVSALGLDP